MSQTQRNQRAMVWLLGLVAVLGFACGRGSLLNQGQLDWVLVLAGATTLLAVCEWCSDRNWAMPVAIITQGSTTALILILHPSWLVGGVVAGCLIIGAFLAWWDARAAQQSTSNEMEEEEVFQSIVLLMKEPRYLDNAILRRLATEAWATEVDVEDLEESDADPFGVSKLHPHRIKRDEQNMKDSPPTIFGDEAPYMCMYWPALLAIHNNASPYFDESDDEMPDLRDPRVELAVNSHNAWISVDLISWMDDTEPQFESVDRLIGQLLAELADEENCTAVIDLINGHIYPFAPDTVSKLRDAKPREALSQPYFSPIMSVADEEMRRAEDQAKRHWPEFVTAFENRSDEDHFNVKARFEQDSAIEYIWLSVTAIEANMIYGELGNDPLHIGGKLGDRVRVPLGDMNDWVHLNAEGERLRGGFTIDVPGRRSDDNGP